jgi:hypothetical protein
MIARLAFEPLGYLVLSQKKGQEFDFNALKYMKLRNLKPPDEPLDNSMSFFYSVMPYSVSKILKKHIGQIIEHKIIS